MAAAGWPASLASARRRLRERLQLLGGSGGSIGGSKLVAARINGAGATFPQPGLRGVGRALQGAEGLTVNYQGIGSGGGIAQFTAGTVDFGATDSRDEGRGDRGRQEEGRPGPHPERVRRGHRVLQRRGLDKGLKLDGATVADIFLGKIKKWNDPAIAKQNPGVEAAERRHHGLPPLRRVGHDQAVHDVPRRLLARVEERPGRRQDGQVADRHRRQGQRRRRGRVKQNDGAVGYVEQAYALANNFTFAAVKNKAGNYVAPTLESTSAAGDGLRCRPTCASARSTRPATEAYPIASGTFLLVYQDMCKAGLSEDKAQAGQGLARLRARRRPGRGQGAAVRAAARTRSTPPPGEGRRPDLQRLADRAELS